MQNQDPRSKIVDLLHWMDRKGLRPPRPSQDDFYLNPFTNEIKKLRELEPHQRKTGLWVPSVKGLRRLGILVEKGRIGDMTIVSSAADDYVGAGPGEAEAVLSFFNQVREAAA